jgi:hypothetical protein
MLDKIREYMARNPWAGWLVALLVFGVAIGTYFFRTQGDSPYSPESMQEMLTVRFTDTDEVIQIPRGRLDKQLRGMGAVLDPTQGIINPKTGKPTGFLVDQSEWDAMISRINSERERNRVTPQGTSGGVRPAPRTDVPKPLDPATGAPIVSPTAPPK